MPAIRWDPVQGVIKSYDPVTGDGVLVSEADLADVDLADDGRATRLRLGSEVDMGTPEL